MMFADDIVICSESREQVEENLERWRFALERRGMKVSCSKIEYMCVNERQGSGTVRLQGEERKKVQEFKYLGSTVQSNGECGKEVKNFQTSVYGSFKSHKTRQPTTHSRRDVKPALRSNPSHLRDLNLSCNDLGDSGKKLMSALKDDEHYKLQTLMPSIKAFHNTCQARQDLYAFQHYPSLIVPGATFHDNPQCVLFQFIQVHMIDRLPV
ncbi:hypothetical protein QTP70_001474 [Hemibagrus guttatus]|uniref:Reverse transcriptase domain-containing protein n=1 Tax=Hemibagrus guttatus TaxID=175788 RepID=A0AAE0PTD7_9TELE|nr:hypothetical protein QTP70_001474 [Hemibagrus guttatus]